MRHLIHHLVRIADLRAPTQNDSAFERLIFPLDGVRLHRPSSDGLFRLPCQRQKRSLSVRRSFCVGALNLLHSGIHLEIQSWPSPRAVIGKIFLSVQRKYHIRSRSKQRLYYEDDELPVNEPITIPSSFILHPSSFTLHPSLSPFSLRVNTRSAAPVSWWLCVTIKRVVPCR